MNKESMIHESMEPTKILIRESRDSKAHPSTVPIIIALDVTGSMSRISRKLIKECLPKITSKIIKNGVKDPSILFLAVGDADHDIYPLQVGQFESSDKEFDTWLNRTYIEGGGGDNVGESYLLAWYFAAHHTSIDAFDKRGQKGFIFTIGDEPSLKTLPDSVIKELMGSDTQNSFTDTELLEAAREKYHVYHLHVTETYPGGTVETLTYWKQLMGDYRIAVEDSTNIPDIISNTILDNSSLLNATIKY